MKRKILKAVLVMLVAMGACVAIFMRGRWGANPCAEPEELPVSRARVVACAERYVFDQWFTDRLGKIGALDADPHGEGTWFELVYKHRNTVRRELSAVCTHPRDDKGALGHTALFESAVAGKPCRTFGITPLLSVTPQGQSCDAVRASHRCVSRAEAMQ